MFTLETMEDVQIEARLLAALETLNKRELVIRQLPGSKQRPNSAPNTVSHFRVQYYPMAGEWLHCSKFADIIENRWVYYEFMEDLVARNLVEVVTRFHGSCVMWRRFFLNNAGLELLNWYRAAKVV